MIGGKFILEGLMERKTKVDEEKIKKYSKEKDYSNIPDIYKIELFLLQLSPGIEIEIQQNILTENFDLSNDEEFFIMELIKNSFLISKENSKHSELSISIFSLFMKHSNKTKFLKNFQQEIEQQKNNSNLLNIIKIFSETPPKKFEMDFNDDWMNFFDFLFSFLLNNFNEENKSYEIMELLIRNTKNFLIKQNIFNWYFRNKENIKINEFSIRIFSIFMYIMSPMEIERITKQIKLEFEKSNVNHSYLNFYETSLEKFYLYFDDPEHPIQRFFEIFLLNICFLVILLSLLSYIAK